MKGATQTIGVVMAVIIAISILVLGFNILGRAEQGIDEIESSGLTQQQRLSRVLSVSQACEDWIYGDKYSAKAILETYELPTKMLPYSKVYGACGEDLESNAKDCLNSDDRSWCVGSGLLSSSADSIIDCTKTCSNVMNIQEMCEVTCSENVPLCFENLINEVSESDLRRTLDFSNRDIEAACE